MIGSNDMQPRYSVLPNDNSLNELASGGLHRLHLCLQLRSWDRPVLGFLLSGNLLSLCLCRLLILLVLYLSEWRASQWKIVLWEDITSEELCISTHVHITSQSIQSHLINEY